MNWPVFAILVYVTLCLQMGLSTLLRIGEVTPNLLLLLAVLVGFSAPGRTLIWAFLVIGVVVDLTHPLLLAGSMTDVVVIGPAALGYLFGAFAILQVRGLLFRDSTLALGFLVAVVGVCVHLATVCVLSLRGLPILTAEPPLGWSAADELVRRFWELLYTMVLAVPISLLTGRGRQMGRWLGFDSGR